jgi:glycyl-tRNA synthetase beta chain
MRDNGLRYDMVQASTNLGARLDDDLWRVRRRAQDLQSFVETEDGTNLLVAYKRAANILKKEDWQGIGASVGADLPEEKALIAALDKADPKASAAIEKEDFTAAMAALASLRKPIDDFFDHVTVNDPDSAKRERRLNLLMRFRDAVNRVADFSKIEG